MPIETVDDIVEEIMDAIGVYGACVDETDGKQCKGGKQCRVCASSGLRARLDAAFDIEVRLGASRRQAERGGE